MTVTTDSCTYLSKITAERAMAGVRELLVKMPTCYSDKSFMFSVPLSHCPGKLWATFPKPIPSQVS